jgi:hypothetical protein
MIFDWGGLRLSSACLCQVVIDIAEEVVLIQYQIKKLGAFAERREHQVQQSHKMLLSRVDGLEHHGQRSQKRAHPDFFRRILN